MPSNRCDLVTPRGIAALVACVVVLSGCIPRANRVASVPTDVTAAGGLDAISLSWTASVGASGYNIKRSTAGGGPYTQIASSSSPSYTDSAVALGTVYYYVVSSLAPDGESANSAEVSASSVVLPSPPGNLSATPGDRQIQLTWLASDGATRYAVKRALTSGGPYAQIADPTAPSYTDTSLTNGTTYYYVISAINLAGESSDSEPVSAVPDVQNPPPTTFGTWNDVTPAGIDLSSELCSNYGATTVQADPAHPSNLYTLFHCQGIYKSTDHGATWTGPINTGTNGSNLNDCSGGISIPPGSTAAVPTIYAACIRGGSVGFWRSGDGGVSWTSHIVAGVSRQDYFQPVVDPYDENHLLMAGHEFQLAEESIVESFDGGETWTKVPLASGMLQVGLNPTIFFINTGTASTTRGTWLWIADAAGGAFGTWRTTNSGVTWTQVNRNEHSGYAQIYQPDQSGAVYMAGDYSLSGPGVLRSRDFGQTWTHVGLSTPQSVVVGTPKNVYSMQGYPVGPGGSIAPSFQVAAQPGTGTWVAPGTPANLTQGPAQIAVVNDGTNNILVGAMYNKGIWRYIEP